MVLRASPLIAATLLLSGCDLFRDVFANPIAELARGLIGKPAFFIAREIQRGDDVSLAIDRIYFIDDQEDDETRFEAIRHKTIYRTDDPGFAEPIALSVSPSGSNVVSVIRTQFDNYFSINAEDGRNIVNGSDGIVANDAAMVCDLADRFGAALFADALLHFDIDPDMPYFATARFDDGTDDIFEIDFEGWTGTDGAVLSVRGRVQGSITQGGEVFDFLETTGVAMVLYDATGTPMGCPNDTDGLVDGAPATYELVTTPVGTSLTGFDVVSNGTREPVYLYPDGGTRGTRATVRGYVAAIAGPVVR